MCAFACTWTNCMIIARPEEGGRGDSIIPHILSNCGEERIAIIRPHARAHASSCVRNLMLFNKQRFSRSLARSFYGHLSPAAAATVASSPLPPSPSVRSRLSGGAGGRRRGKNRDRKCATRNLPVSEITGSWHKSRR